MGGDLGIGDVGVGGCWGGYRGRYWGGVYIVLFKKGFDLFRFNLLIPLILVPLHTLMKISSTHLMQFFKLIPMV